MTDFKVAVVGASGVVGRALLELLQFIGVQFVRLSRRPPADLHDTLIWRAAMTLKSGAQSGAVTLIQRFGSALNLNLHFHMLYLDGAYDTKI